MAEAYNYISCLDEDEILALQFIEEESSDDEFYSQTLHQNGSLRNSLLTSLLLGDPEKPINQAEPRCGGKDWTFRRRYRVTKKTFRMVLDIMVLRGYLKEECTRCKERIPPKISLLSALMFLGSQCTYNDIADHLKISLIGVENHLQCVIRGLSRMASGLIKWPSENEAPCIASNFKDIANFPGVIGAIGGCSLTINTPSIKQKMYLDERTKTHCVTLLAVCDAQQRFRFISCGFPGGYSYYLAFAKSDLGKMLKKGYDLVYSDKYHMIGDNAFELETCLMVPFRGEDLTAKQIQFNSQLIASKVVLETAFISLKTRFPRLAYFHDHSHVRKIVNAACMLHNVALDSSEERALIADEIEEKTFLSENPSYAQRMGSVAGFEKRNKLVDKLKHV